MITTVLSGSQQQKRRFVKAFCILASLLLAGLSRPGVAQDHLVAGLSHNNFAGALASARLEMAVEENLPLLERLEALEQLTENASPTEMKALFTEGLPCQMHSRIEDEAVITEVHPLFPARVAPALAPAMTPTPSPIVQETTTATASDRAYMSEKIQSLQRMLQLMEAKEKLVENRNYYERKLGEFENKLNRK